MELPRQPGAGPESTGIENEQLALFECQANEDARPCVGDADHDPIARSHRLAQIPERTLESVAHLVMRGARLDGVCGQRRARGLS